MAASVDVVLILWNPDVIQLLSLVLLDRGLKSCGIEPSDGAEMMEELIESCTPSVVAFDLCPPYSESSEVLLQLLRRFPLPAFVVTCADRSLVLKAAPWLSRYPIFQKPYELDEIGRTVGSMVTCVEKK